MPIPQAPASSLALSWPSASSCRADLRESLLEGVRAAERTTVEVDTGGRSYALLPVDLPEFGFINVYGTDITAVRERERLARENERLLLNILPEPIAQRLRIGEPLIADRFDDVTVLFADIVEFTRLSSTMSPPSSWASSTTSSASSTIWSTGTSSRRSRPSVTPTWSSGGCRGT